MGATLFSYNLIKFLLVPLALLLLLQECHGIFKKGHGKSVYHHYYPLPVGGGWGWYNGHGSLGHQPIVIVLKQQQHHGHHILPGLKKGHGDKKLIVVVQPVHHDVHSHHKGGSHYHGKSYYPKYSHGYGHYDKGWKGLGYGDHYYGGHGHDYIDHKGGYY